MEIIARQCFRALCLSQHRQHKALNVFILCLAPPLRRDSTAFIKFVFWLLSAPPVQCDSRADGRRRDTQPGGTGGGLDISTQLGAQQDNQEGTGTHFVALTHAGEKREGTKKGHFRLFE